MKTSKIEMAKSKIEACESIIIQDPWYEPGTRYTYQLDRCANITHAKAMATNYDEHYKDEHFEFDMNTTEFALLLGSNKFVSAISFEVRDNGNIDVFLSDPDEYARKRPVEIGCDRAEFSFGNEKTFGAFTISTGADGRIGEVHTFKVKGSSEPVGVLFVGALDGGMVPPEEIIESFKAAFGAERERKEPLKGKIKSAERKAGGEIEASTEEKQNGGMDRAVD